MELIAFIIVSIVLYVVAGQAVAFYERQRGAPSEHRSVIFFCILLGLALITFPLIRTFLGQAP